MRPDVIIFYPSGKTSPHPTCTMAGTVCLPCTGAANVIMPELDLQKMYTGGVSKAAACYLF